MSIWRNIVWQNTSFTSYSSLVLVSENLFRNLSFLLSNRILDAIINRVANYLLCSLLKMVDVCR